MRDRRSNGDERSCYCVLAAGVGSSIRLYVPVSSSSLIITRSAVMENL
jgi:hypothetical protein